MHLCEGCDYTYAITLSWIVLFKTSFENFKSNQIIAYCRKLDNKQSRKRKKVLFIYTQRHFVEQVTLFNRFSRKR